MKKGSPRKFRQHQQTVLRPTFALVLVLLVAQSSLCVIDPAWTSRSCFLILRDLPPPNIILLILRLPCHFGSIRSLRWSKNQPCFQGRIVLNSKVEGKRLTNTPVRGVASVLK